MSKEITINKQTLQVKQYNGKNVVTFKDIDLCHERPEGTAKRNFNANKRHFIEGTDYFKVCADEIRTHKIMDISSKTREDITLITESGYYMIVKSFTDELSWVVQRELVNTYFKYKEEPVTLVTQTPYEYFEKTWKGEPVLTAKDIQHMTGFFRTTVVSWMKTYGTILKDYYALTGKELMNFKVENPRIGKSVHSLYVITKAGFNSLCSAYGIKTDEPKCFELPKVEKTFTEEVAEIKEKLVAINVLLDRLMDMKRQIDNETTLKARQSISDKYSESFLKTVNNLGMLVSVDISALDRTYFRVSG